MVIRLTSLLFSLLFSMTMTAQLTLSGKVLDDAGNPISYAHVAIVENGLWSMSNEKGLFMIKGVESGKMTLTVHCLGYQKRSWVMTFTKSISNLKLVLKEENLALDEVMVVAKRKANESTTSYSIDHVTLENQQIINVSDINALLPGGKTTNPTLMSDNRLSLRSGSSEMGNASFGTAVEVDGIRLDNNATAGETTGPSTRTVSTANIENVEVITGIPSVEYGDLSNGVVKVNTRKGKSPFTIDGRMNQHTRQIAVSKGFDLGHSKGVLNTSFEHARSFSDAASPYTAYQRNILSLNYMNTFFKQSMPLTLNIGVTGNVGGYNSKSDPDEEQDDYSKARDNALRANLTLNWQLGRKWITSLQLQGTLSYADQLSETYSHTTSASTQPYIHVMTEGYHIAQQFDDHPQADIILGPTGAWNEQHFGSKNWYVQSFTDSKPFNWSLQMKGDWVRRFGKMLNRLMTGCEYKGNRNLGRGKYYADMRYAPTWREYRYDELPAMHNLALYAEEKVSIPTTRHATFELTAGLRDDITLIKCSDYGTVSSISPRFNSRYIFWRNRQKYLVRDLTIHAGWGKSVKLPSFQVLYPSTRYYDALAFSSPSTADNTSFYAYYTHPSKPFYNAGLQWQYTHQTDIGIEMDIKGSHVSLTAYHHRTHHPYMSSSIYTPFAYKYTPPSSLNGMAIASANRQYAIDKQTGVVTVSDITGLQSPKTLDYNERRTFPTHTLYDNGTAVDRYGMEWIIDFKQIRALRTSLRLDGNYYYYKGIEEKLMADIPYGNLTMADGQPYQFVGFYRGGASAANGSLKRHLNLNSTLTTHIPKIRLVVSLRLETTLYHYSRSLSEYSDGIRAIVLVDKGDYFGTPYDGGSENQNLAVYPDYYITWSNPDEKIPFAHQFLWAKDNDASLYNELTKMVVKTNYAYVMNPDRISAYYSANLNVTKEIGDHITMSFYANNFFNNLRKVHSSQTDRYTSLFGSGYIPSYYYGLALKLKI